MDRVILWLNANSGWLQIVALAVGVFYMVLQIFQSRWMWYADFITCIAALLVAFSNFDNGSWAPLWAQVALNTYFITMAAIGIFRWRQLSEQSGGRMHILKLSPHVIRIAAVIVLAGGPLLCCLLSVTNDPAPVADGICLIISIVAAWFLTRSHIEQWWMWMGADLIAIVIYAEQDAWWMVALYYCYVVSSVIGMVHWRRNAVYIEWRKK